MKLLLTFASIELRKGFIFFSHNQGCKIILMQKMALRKKVRQQLCKLSVFSQL